MSTPRRGLRFEQATLTFYVLWVSTWMLLFIGLVMVFSVQSVAVPEENSNIYTDFTKYLAVAAGGLVGMWIISRLPPTWLRRLSWPALVGTIALQGLVFSPLGVTVYGNRNWIQVPFIGQGQPSEFLKLGLALALGSLMTWYANKRQGRAVKFGWLGVLVAIGAVAAGRDLGTVVILVVLVATALWIGGLSRRWLVGLGLFGLLFMVASTMLSANRRMRISSWLDPQEKDASGVGYQPLHGKWALGTGGWIGVGPGASRQKWGYLTQADTDYIFAILGEEFGLVGCLVVIGLFIAVGWCCLRLMRRHSEPYVIVTTAAICGWIVGQALINMMVVTGLLPVLGVPLPLISRGGTALLAVLFAMGVLVAFARHEPGAQEAFAANPGGLRRTLAVINPRRNRA